MVFPPADSRRKLNVLKTFRRRLGRLLNVLCMFNICRVPTGELAHLMIFEVTLRRSLNSLDFLASVSKLSKLELWPVWKIQSNIALSYGVHTFFPAKGKILSWALTFQKIFAKLQISPVMLEKIPSFVYFVFKNENKWILKV